MVDNGLGETIRADEKYYLNDERLPTVGTRYEWTDAMKEELKKAESDVTYFAQRFFTIVDLSDGKRKRIPLRPYQLEFLRSMQDSNRVVFNTARQIGKCVDGGAVLTVRHRLLPFLRLRVRIGTLYRIARLRQWALCAIAGAARTVGAALRLL